MLVIGRAKTFSHKAAVGDGLNVGVVSRGRHARLLRHQQRLLLVVPGEVTLVLVVVGLGSAIGDIVLA